MSFHYVSRRQIWMIECIKKSGSFGELYLLQRTKKSIPH